MTLLFADISPLPASRSTSQLSKFSTSQTVLGVSGQAGLSTGPVGGSLTPSGSTGARRFSVAQFRAS